jgi:hypothetical protein
MDMCLFPHPVSIPYAGFSKNSGPGIRFTVSFPFRCHHAGRKSDFMYV